MPYIKSERRAVLDPLINGLIAELEMNGFWKVDGDVNYVFTRILKTIYPPESYFYLNRAVGVVESAKLEYYRRVAIPYEHQKMQANGDVQGPAEEE